MDTKVNETTTDALHRLLDEAEQEIVQGKVSSSYDTAEDFLENLKG